MTNRVPDAEKAYAALLAAVRAADVRAHRLVGIHSGGVWIARRLARDLGIKEPVGALDISFYRDDYDRIGLHAEVKPTALPFEIDQAAILLVDDVLYTGRTIRGALNVLFDYGRPARVDLAVLADRGGRQLPIEARFCGVSLELAPQEGLTLSDAGTADAPHFEFALEATPAS